MEKEGIDLGRLMDISEVAQRLGVKVNTVYSWVNQRKIPYVKMGRLLKFDLSDIAAWVAERKVKPMEF